MSQHRQAQHPVRKEKNMSDRDQSELNQNEADFCPITAGLVFAGFLLVMAWDWLANKFLKANQAQPRRQQEELFA